MGQAKTRKAALALAETQAYAHLQAAGAGWAPQSEAWLRENFVATLADAAMQGSNCWQNRVYRTALCHPDAAVRAGIRLVMDNVFTAGLEPGRTVFGLFADVTLARREVVGEFDHCEPLEAWIATCLGVAPTNVYARHGCLFAPAHAGLFCISTTLMPLAAPKPKGVKPSARTRTTSDDIFRRQALLFLVSVRSTDPLDLSKLTQAPFECELNYWGPEDAEPVSTAIVQPIEPVTAFDGIEMLSFRSHLAQAAMRLSEWRDTSILQTLWVEFRHATGTNRVIAEREVAGRLEGTDMPLTPLYQGPDAEYFAAQLPRLGLNIRQ